jgi:dephospho-CoA kinase
LTVIGITGPYASGKSSVAGELVERGWAQIEVDRLGHDALAACAREVIGEFGETVASDDGRAVDRRRLGSIVFSDPAALARLEAIVHPEMVRRTAELIEEHRRGPSAEPGIIVNAAILYKMKLDALCDFVLWIHAPRFTRALRARRRDSLPWKEIFKRIAAQKDLDPQLVSGNVDMYRVDNRILSVALRRIDEILQVRVWNRTKPTSSSSS